MLEFKNERILHKMAWEICNLMKTDSGSDLEEIEKMLSHIANHRSTLPLIKFYDFVSERRIKQKQRRGIGYKIDLILTSNPKLMNNPEVKWITKS